MSTNSIAVVVILALVFCIGLAAPAFAEETSKITITIPGLLGYTNEYWEYDNESQTSSTVSLEVKEDLVIEIENPPIYYYVETTDNSTRYVFRMPYESGFSMNHSYAMGEWLIGNSEYSGGTPYPSSQGWFGYGWYEDYIEDESFSFAYHSRKLEFYKDGKSIHISFFYLSPGHELDRNSPELSSVFREETSSGGWVQNNGAVMLSDPNINMGLENCWEALGYSRLPISGLTTPPAPVTKTVNPTASTVYVNGKAVAFEAYNIDGNNFFKLRDLAQALSGTDKQFEVGYDSASKAITLTSGKAYTPVGGELAQGDGKAKTASPTASKIYKDGAEVDLTVYNINGNNFFKLRDLMQLFDIGVGYDNDTKAITLDTSLPYTD